MTAAQERLYALDAFRGLTIATMILVNTPGSWSHIYAPLRHAPWHGCTPTDLVFPFFLFIVGTAMWFSFSRFGHRANTPAVKKVLKRTALIFIIGLLLNAFPFVGRDYSQLRILGVFQRIALAYGGAGLLILFLKDRQLKFSALFILFAYWALLWIFGGSDPYGLEGNLVRRIDLALLGENRLWGGTGIPFDPEGLFSTFPAMVTVILGYYTGRLISSSKDRPSLVNDMFWWAVIALVTGLFWNNFFPINKALWTSSYVIYSAGWALLTLAFMILLIDVRGHRQLTQPLVVFGTNPLFVFVLSIVWVKTLIMILKWTTPDGSRMNAYSWLYSSVFQPLAGDLNGSLLFALSHILVYWFILLLLYRRNIIIKI